MRVESAGKLLLGLFSGAAFGALLRRGHASRSDLIMRQLQLEDASIVKIMATAVAVGAAGVHALARAGRGKIDVKPLQLGGIVGGGLVFGTGLALLGYCPGTSLAAVGEGRRDALAGVLGMLAGAGLFVQAYPALEPLISAGDRGKVSLAPPGRSPWPWVAGIGSVVTGGYAADRLRALR